MKGIFTGFILVMLFAGTGAHGQEPLVTTADAGITPSSRFLYEFDIFAEDIRQGLTAIFSGPGAEKEYIKERIKERDAEMDAISVEVIDEKNLWRSAEFGRAAALKRGHHKSLRKLEKEHDEQKQTMPEYKDFFELQQDDLDWGANWLGELQKKKDSLRTRMAEARKAGDQTRVDALYDELRAVKKEYNENALLFNQFRTMGELEAETYETLFTGTDNAELTLWRAGVAKKELLEGNETRGMKVDLVALGIDKLDALMDAAKTAIAEQQAADAARLSGDIDRTLRDVRKNTKRTLAEKERAAAREDERIKKNLPAEELAPKPAPAPVPKPAAPKPAAPKKQAPAPAPAPAQNPVITKPLMLRYYPNLTGEVDKFFSAAYDAQDGVPPYHFRLAVDVGSPPIGLTLDANGRLSGTPKAAGVSRFGVCAVDAADTSVCFETVMTINPAVQAPPPPPPPPPPPAATKEECGPSPTMDCNDRCNHLEYYESFRCRDECNAELDRRYLIWDACVRRNE